LVGLEARGFDSIEAHRLLWQEAADFFQDAANIWQVVPVNGELLNAHPQLLAQLRELAADRVQFYTLDPGERRVYMDRKAD
jgi:hypothetical protein